MPSLSWILAFPRASTQREACFQSKLSASNSKVDGKGEEFFEVLSTFGAGGKTRLESSMKKFNLYCEYRPASAG